jgi:hypothetical protein
MRSDVFVGLISNRRYFLTRKSSGDDHQESKKKEKGIKTPGTGRAVLVRVPCQSHIPGAQKKIKKYRKGGRTHI